ncbi:MAG: outer membrane protein assembly factor BamD [Deltaproteobacteria bacterium]|nr:outer membrane protein assembly factor BamD [Deltaproteobacteria bacterium]
MKWHAPLAVALIAATALMGCGAKKRLSADEYFSKATKDFEDGSYQLAIEQYREMLDQYPFTEHGEEAELKIAHGHYLGGNLAEALAAFTDFQRRHPTSPQLAFVGYVLGQCYKQQMGTIDRDQTASQNAHNYFATVAQQYPSSPFAQLAREQLADCRARLAGHELYIADFYAQRDNRRAAEMRLLALVSRYNDTDISADALSQLARIYRKQNDSERALLADAALAQRFPHSKPASGARRRIARSGKQEVLNGDDPMPRLLAGLPRTTADPLAAPVLVPGIEPPRERPVPSAVPALAPPAPLAGSPY